MGETTPIAVQRTHEYTKLLRDIENERLRKQALERGETAPPPVSKHDLKFVSVDVYVCPHEECDEYFGHAGMPALETRLVATHDMNFTPRPVTQHHSRAQCPTCRLAGRQVERIRVTASVAVPLLRAADDAA